MNRRQGVHEAVDRTHLDRASDVPAYRQLYVSVRDAILTGTLRPGARLPSTRSLAAQLAVARATVDLAYSLLAAEGFIESRGAAGSFVDANVGIASKLGFQRNGSMSSGGADAVSSAQVQKPWHVRPFQMGLPAFDVFPRRLWTRLAVRRARELSPSTMGNQDPAGLLSLRTAVANHLRLARGISCSPEQVVITSGFQGALGLIGHCLLDRGDPVWVEDPGYVYARLALAAAGAKVVPIPVDGEGLRVDAGIARVPGARFAIVTPSHQMPLGMAMTLSRRLSLLNWAKRNEAWIIEDDYDSEFRYSGRPLPALKSLDETGRVLYVGTFSKVLFPALRLGYIVAAKSEVARLIEAQEALYPDRAYLVQAVIADFIEQGHFARHIRRMKAIYAERRLALTRALETVLEDADIELQAGGMHLLARFRRADSDAELAKRAAAHGLAPTPLSRHCVETKLGPALLLSFTNVSAGNAQREAERLRDALGAVIRRATRRVGIAR